MSFILEDNSYKAVSKRYSYDYEEYDEQGKSAETMIPDILNDEDFPKLKELIIGNWGDAGAGDDCQPVIDDIIENKERFSNIESLFIGDMEYDECEVSWIEQGDYSKLWEAMPQLKQLGIKGSIDLELGNICHENLEELCIVCGGIYSDVIEAIQKAKLPHLKRLQIYIGVEDYGFDGDENTIKAFLEQADFPELTYLGIVNSEMQDEITEMVLNSKFIGQISTLDLSMGTLTDKGAALLLEKIPQYPNIQKLDVHYNYLSDEMVEKLEALPIEVDASENETADIDEDDGYVYRSPMLTE